MKKWLGLYLCVLFQFPVQAESLDLDTLLEEVKQAQGISGKINKQREVRFLAEKNNQQKLLKASRSELLKQEKISQQKQSKLDANEKELSQLETALNNRSGILGELFGVARQAAGDLEADLMHSLVSAQYPGRLQQLNSLANNKSLPTISQLESLWFTLQQEMTESGKVVSFQTEILSSAGEPKQANVIRIGSFNVLADGKYLRYLPETGKLVELARQPDAKFLSLAEDIVDEQSSQADIAIDPTRGVMLSLLIQTPDAIERVQQGGVIGYIILGLGFLGLVYAILRLVELSLTGQKMAQQINNSEAVSDNPLGRVIMATRKSKDRDMETFELLLDEAITKEVPALEKGISMIKLLASVTPLLGLLGTVTGMIATFQAISLFGTGDPKLMASGISQALVTTMLGLCVAVPLLFMHSLVASRSRVLVQILDEQSAGLISKRSEK